MLCHCHLSYLVFFFARMFDNKQSAALFSHKSEQWLLFFWLPKKNKQPNGLDLVRFCLMNFGSYLIIIFNFWSSPKVNYYLSIHCSLNQPIYLFIYIHLEIHSHSAHYIVSMINNRTDIDQQFQLNCSLFIFSVHSFNRWYNNILKCTFFALHFAWCVI